jgi:hypothetical protein
MDRFKVADLIMKSMLVPGALLDGNFISYESVSQGLSCPEFHEYGWERFNLLDQ